MRLYGGIDGAHHKDWVLDQVARVLTGTVVRVYLASWSDGATEFRIRLDAPSEHYLRWVAAITTGEDGPDTYEYNTGIAP